MQVINKVSFESDKAEHRTQIIEVTFERGRFAFLFNEVVVDERIHVTASIRPGRAIRQALKQHFE